MNYVKDVEASQLSVESYRKAIESIAAEVQSACKSESRRAGKVEAYNLPVSLSEKILNIYAEHCTIRRDGSRAKWLMGRGVQNTAEYLGGWSIGYYGRNADKFYVYRFTEQQRKETLDSLAAAAQENEAAL